MSGRPEERAFSRIELVVIIVLLAVLIAVFLPEMVSGENAILVGCRNNQMRLALAARMYADDSTGRFPNLDNLVGNDGPVAFTLLTKYAGSQTNVFICPAVARERARARRRFVPQLTAGFFASNGNDYAYYDWLTKTTNLLPLIADRLAWTNRSSRSKVLNHPSGKAMVAFTDGHVEMLRRRFVVATNLTPPWSAVQDPLRLP